MSTITDRLTEAWSEGDPTSRNRRFDALLTDGYLRHSDQGTLDREEFKDVVTELMSAFPDLAMKVVDAVEQGDRLAYRWESVGTHEGVYLGVPETQQVVVAHGMTMCRIVNEQIAEEWTSWDKASVLNSMGILRLS